MASYQNAKQVQGDIGELIFGKEVYTAASNKYRRPPKLNNVLYKPVVSIDDTLIDPSEDLPADKEDLRLISSIPLNGQLPVVEIPKKEELKVDRKYYKVEIPLEKLKEREKVYAKLDLKTQGVPWLEIYAGKFDRMRIQFPGYFEDGEILMLPGNPKNIYIPVSVSASYQELMKQKQPKA